MTWTRLSDDFCEDERIVNLSDGAFRLYVAALVYSNKRLTDGYVPRGVLPMLVPAHRPSHVRELLNTKPPLWRNKPGGCHIEDFLAHQLSKAQVLRIRQARADNGRVGGVRSGMSRRARSKQAGSNGPSKSEAPALAKASPVPRTPDPSAKKYVSSETEAPRHIRETVMRLSEQIGARP